MTIREVDDPSNTSVMSQMTEYGLGDVVYWVLVRLGGSMDGLKKLMKLLFLIQYDIGKSILNKRLVNTAVKYLYNGKPITRAEFYLWSFGPMSNEVYDVVDKLEDEGLIRTEAIDNLFTTVRIIINKGWQVRELPEPVAGRVDEVVSKYGNYKGWELERLVKEMLDLTSDEKRSYYMGYYVDDYLREGGFEFSIRDLAHGWVKK